MDRGLLARLAFSLSSRSVARADGLYISRAALTAWLADLGLRKPGRYLNDCFADPRIADLQNTLDSSLYGLEVSGILEEFCGYAAGAADWQLVKQEAQKLFQIQQQQRQEQIHQQQEQEQQLVAHQDQQQIVAAIYIYI